MQRRSLLGSALALPALGLPLHSLAQAAHLAQAALPMTQAAAASAPLSSAAFEQGLAGAPELLPLRGWDGQDREAAQLRIEGRWPRALQGVLYRNGPGLIQRDGQRYRHWFDGDGLVHAWRFEPGRASHRARFVQTPKFKAEQQAGRFLLPTLGTAIAPQRPITGADSLNTANTSVLPLAGRLHALWEGGSAYELDADTLATRGARAWAPELAGMPFSAHPKIEPSGEVWNFGSTADRLAIYHLSPQGELLRHRVMTLRMAAMVHDFAVSQQHLIFLLAPIALDRETLQQGGSLSAAMRWRAQDATRVLVLDKATLTPRWFELPAALVFHFGNAWESADEIVLDYVEAPPLPEFTQRIGALMGGEQVRGTPSTLRFLRLPLKGGEPVLTARDEPVEFPVVDPRVVAQRHRYLFCPTRVRDPQRWGFDALMRLDLEQGTRQRFVYDEEVMLEEHLLVPRPGSTREGEGWLLGSGYDVKRQRSFVSVFDAEHLADGPLARAWLPYWIPLGFHGRFVPA